MTRVRVNSLTVSLDGYGAGSDQDIDNPLGIGRVDLQSWLVTTRTFQRTLFGKDCGTTGVDHDFAARGFRNIGSPILGRNMFGPIRGEWPDMNWKGWWGDDPPYHVPVFILTHYPHIRLPGRRRRAARVCRRETLRDRAKRLDRRRRDHLRRGNPR